MRLDPVGWAKGFGRFWWDFVIGDDWTVAAAVAVAIGATWALARTDVPAWWLLPLAAAAAVAASLRRTSA